MMLYRSLVVGLLGACLYLLASRAPATRIVHAAAAQARPPSVPVLVPKPGPTLIDVSSQMSPAQLVSLVRLAPNEHIAAYDDHRAYVDITVDGPRSERRVLLLVH